MQAARRRTRINRASAHRSRHKASDGFSDRALDRPNHGTPVAVRLRDHRVVRYIDPFAVETDAIVSLFRIPIGIRNRDAVRVRAARTLAAPQGIEPLLQGRAGIAPVVARSGRSRGEQKNSRDGKAREIPHFSQTQRATKRSYSLRGLDWKAIWSFEPNRFSG